MVDKEGIKVFFSYSRKDGVLRDQLAAHLTALKWRGVIQDWNDHQIEEGTDWSGAIAPYIDTSDIILLLLSPDFLASEHSRKEANRVLKRHESGQARVLPVLLRPIDYAETPFSTLPATPRNGIPITRWPNKDEALLSVAKDIHQAAEACLA
ncbi:MAG: toll/interleukin-1 receptor domain-containing protein [Oculatellaceae cyanobacterium Prado106]|jgi:hypothetical protein|nr:toll/interleukin-1 receptor domain-containing protein [Oculatellaceae cyanobacterium Prado106]